MLNRAFVTALMAATVLFSSCGKDEDTVRKSAVEFNGKSYDTPLGLYNANGSATTGYQVDVELTNYEFGGTTLTMPPSEIHTFFFGVKDMEAEALAAGTYRYSVNDETSAIQYAGFDYGLKISQMQAGEEQEFEAGTVEVKKDGENYTITYEFTTAEGAKASGYYSGVLKKSEF